MFNWVSEFPHGRRHFSTSSRVEPLLELRWRFSVDVGRNAKVTRDEERALRGINLAEEQEV